MKYKALLTFLRVLIYAKRSLWWAGGRLGAALRSMGAPVWRLLGWVRYKINYALRRVGFTASPEFFLKRDFLQIILGIVVLSLTFPQTKLLAKADPLFAGRDTLAYRLLAPEDENEIQEIGSSEVTPITPIPAWRLGTLNAGSAPGEIGVYPIPDQMVIVAGGGAIAKPYIIPGANFGGSSGRTQVVEYRIEPGDSLSSIAYGFGVSVATILWENNLSERSLLRPGDVLRIPPATGVMHNIARGDTLGKIATRYGVKPEEIVAFNHLKSDGTDLVIGEKIMVPGGIKPQQRALAQAPRTAASFQRVAAPPRSSAAASSRGFVWPAGVRTITQYFSWRHHAVDIAGPWQTAIYAAKGGVVETSQCGWNGGYGCYIIIDHGGGVKTLYGHHSSLLVSPGERVEAGQTIALMGNTGNVRGHTGIHLHFEVMINGVRVNPLGYVR
jgi:murein DD-endopeptidase MepM/ murein hydrolase activator NlpD